MGADIGHGRRDSGTQPFKLLKSRMPEVKRGKDIMAKLYGIVVRGGPSEPVMPEPP